MLGAGVHHSMLANHASYRIPLCRNAPQKGGLDNGAAVSLLCFSLRLAILDLWRIALSVTNDESDPG